MPFTSGILVGIGETRAERVEALLALKAIHQQYGHIQVQLPCCYALYSKCKQHQRPPGGHLGDQGRVN